MGRRRFRTALLFIAAILPAVSSMAQQPATKTAQSSAEVWLALVDNQNYIASWDTAANLFKNAISSDMWTAAARQVRAPLGSIRSRSLKTAKESRTLPGVPDGDYVIIQFDTTFEKKEASVETVTMVRETDGLWRTGGYFIR